MCGPGLDDQLGRWRIMCAVLRGSKGYRMASHSATYACPLTAISCTRCRRNAGASSISQSGRWRERHSHVGVRGRVPGNGLVVAGTAHVAGVCHVDLEKGLRPGPRNIGVSQRTLIL